MSRSETLLEGRVSLHTIRADIDYGDAEAKTTFGRIGVKVWINKGEIMPEGYETIGGTRGWATRTRHGAAAASRVWRRRPRRSAAAAEREGLVPSGGATSAGAAAAGRGSPVARSAGQRREAAHRRDAAPGRGP